MPKEDQKCEINTNKIIQIFCGSVLLPTLLLRIYGHNKFKNRNVPLLQKAYFSAIYVFFNASYGIWSIYNITRFMLLPNVCKNLDYLSVINYQLTLIYGCLPALNLIIVILVCVFLIPVFIYQFYNSLNENMENNEGSLLTEALI